MVPSKSKHRSIAASAQLPYWIAFIVVDKSYFIVATSASLELCRSRSTIGTVEACSKSTRALSGIESCAMSRPEWRWRQGDDFTRCAPRD